MQPATNSRAIDICRNWRCIGMDGLALGNGHGLAVWMPAQEYSRWIVELYAMPFSISAALAGCGHRGGQLLRTDPNKLPLEK